MGELSKLPNIGKTLEEKLIEAGIHTKDELQAIGSEEAWLRIREKDPTACLHMLLALEGAVQNVKKAMLSQEDKEHMHQIFKKHQKDD